VWQAQRATAYEVGFINRVALNGQHETEAPATANEMLD